MRPDAGAAGSAGPATRSRLLELRRRRAEARAGHDLLERKREVLLREVWGLLRELSHHERDVRQRFGTAYAALREARLTMGSEGLAWAALAPAARTECVTESRSVMGVALPLVRVTVTPLPLPYSPFGTSVTMDRARQRWLEVGEVLGSWAEAYGSVWRASAELARTQRRVNALEKLVIPRYEAAIRTIEAALEEQERETFLRSKRVKERKEAEGGE
ncbi:MAG TPA: V-type ATP synthase subunit D [Trueperaceae bacterium]|nr:V-type ATP synthase subunit D [Trueperaceae bacterium]